MGDPRGRRRRWRIGFVWLCSLAILGYTVATRAPERHEDRELLVVGTEEPPDGGKQGASGPSLGTASRASLKITAISAAEVKPGDALVVRVAGIDPDDPSPIGALIGGDPVDVLARRDDLVVVKISPETPVGKAGLRVAQGTRRSKSRDLLVKREKPGKSMRNLLGGLALLIFGVRTLSGGVRKLAGHRLRALLARATRGPVRAVGLGAVVGALTQLTTAATGLTVGLLESRLLALEAAVALLVGAQLGAAALSALLPLTFGREGLVVVTLGVLWITLAVDRRMAAVGNALLGGGLMIYGLHLLRLGFEPLVADPGVLGYVRLLETGGFAGLLACALAGVVLAALLQGPGPLFGLVAVLVGASGQLGLPHALAVLTGTGLGAALDVALVAWPAGTAPRRLATAHLVLGTVATLIMFAGLRLWIFLADVIVPGDPAELAHGAKVLMPHFQAHLVAGFLIAQVVATAVTAALAPAVARWTLGRDRDEHAARAADRRWLEGALVRALGHDQRALDEALALVSKGDRVHGATSEHALEDARGEVDALFAALVVRTAADPEIDALRATVVRVHELQRSIEGLLRIAERCVESGAGMEEEEQRGLRTVHAIVSDGLGALARALEAGQRPELEAVRAREIELNAAREAGGRSALKARRPGASGSLRLWLTELIDAYEQVGNQLYRVCETLETEPIDSLPG